MASEHVDRPVIRVVIPEGRPIATARLQVWFRMQLPWAEEPKVFREEPYVIVTGALSTEDLGNWWGVADD